ncbi:hypothetical protein [Virgibacillus ihumii]|uniref:hypothetical protein n=1 Tax=Virgibacillus ihumii TaxID=2686091 RepID=UPI00157C299C|nr:hypothetical protein [Virgibacillus ihumii]
MLRFLLFFGLSALTFGLEYFLVTEFVPAIDQSFATVAFFVGVLGVIISLLFSSAITSLPMMSYYPDPEEFDRTVKVKKRVKAKALSLLNPILIGSLPLFLYGLFKSFNLL